MQRLILRHVYTGAELRLAFTLIVSLLLLAFEPGKSQTSINGFGSGAAVFNSNSTSTAIIPNASDGASTTFVRVGNQGGSVNIVNPGIQGLGCGSQLSAQAATGSTIVKATPMFGVSGATSQAYVRFNIELGSSTGGSGVANGNWAVYIGNGTMFNNTSDFTNTQVFAGLRFTYSGGTSLNTEYRNGTGWSSVSTGIIQGTTATVELVMNNSGSTINYNLNGAQSVPVNRFDLFVNGTRVGNDLNKGTLPGSTIINSICAIGQASTSNAAWLFMDDLSFSTAISGTIPYPTVALDNQTVGAGSIQQGRQDAILQILTATPSTLDAILDGLTITTTGNYLASDVTHLHLILSSNNVLDASDEVLSTITNPGTAGSKTFSSLNCALLPVSTTSYLFITADLSCSANTGRTIGVGSTSFSNFSFSQGRETGADPVDAGGTQTITAGGSPSISSQPTAISACAGTNQTLSVAATGLSPNYQWRLNGADIPGANSATLGFNPLNTGSAGTYSVVVSNNCGSVTSNSATVTVNTVPAVAGNIAGSTSLCAGQNNVSYSVGAISGANSYVWTYSGTGATVSGSGNAVTISFNNTATSGSLTVQGSNSCGSGLASPPFAITVNPLPSNAAPITGAASVCAGESSVSYSTPTIANASTYIWQYSGSGVTIIGNGNSVTLSFASNATSGNLTVRGNNACGNSPIPANFPITVNNVPPAPGGITGSSSVCQGQNNVAYSISAVGSATSYTWNYTGTGHTITGTGTAVSISFSTAATSGSLTVRANNGCGSSTPSSVLAINVNQLPGAAGTITGSSSVCTNTNNENFSVPVIPNANSYQWQYTGTGASITGSAASVTINFSNTATTGTLTVRGTNACGPGATSIPYLVTVNTRPQVNNFSLPACSGSTANLTPVNGTHGTVPAGSTYTWLAPVATGITGMTAGTNAPAANQTLFRSGTTSANVAYTMRASNAGCMSANFTVTVTVNPAPPVAITPDYCSSPGLVVLSATAGFSSYTWNNGASGQIINIDQAGRYEVTATNAFGCQSSASLNVALELVTNGDFEAGNSGFTSQYVNSPTDLVPEGTYAVLNNPNTAHPLFYGIDHTTGSGRMIVVNGSSSLVNFWGNTVTVLPNTTYYFSAWAMSVNAVAPFASLQFKINGLQVGTIATLTTGPLSNGGPFNWTRFYGSWNSGPATTADLSIVNLQTALGGNDFALDDISFGTLSPFALQATPMANSNAGVCAQGPLALQSNVLGGASPYTYAWTGPNGFTSNSPNALVTNSATTANSGTYNLSITDGLGCTLNTTVPVVVNALPINVSIQAVNASICANTAAQVQVVSSENGVSYQLMRQSDNVEIGDEEVGNGSTITLNAGILQSSTTFFVIARRYTTGCSRQLSGTVTINVSTTPQLVITNQAICSGSVNLTAAAVTAGSTGGGTLSYWTNASATTPLANPSNVLTPGTYFIRSVVGSCSDIEPVVVAIGNSPNTTFSYSGSPFCSNGSNPLPNFGSGAAAGTFTSSVGLVFVSSSTGQINLSASLPGTYTVQNSIQPVGVCTGSTSISIITITGYPKTGFSYVSNALCQSVGANNPAPVFEPGGQAGTFSSSAGLTFVSTSTGVVNLAASTPGNYAIVNTVPSANGCPVAADTVFIDINPYTFAGSVVASASVAQVCEGLSFQLFTSGTSYLSVLERERFNGSITSWTTGNNSTGGTVAAAAWTLRPNGHSNFVTYNSNDDSQFFLSDSRAQGGGGTTSTTLQSPALSTIGYTSLSLDFFHFFDQRSGSSANVQVSTNGSTWTTIQSFSSDVGSSSDFSNSVINLNAYIGLPEFYIRFLHTSPGGNRYWAIDNVSITGNCTRYNYTWTSSPAGYNSVIQNPIVANVSQSAFYVSTAMNTYGCTTPAPAVPVTVNPIPGDNAGNDVLTCSGQAISIGSTPLSGRTYVWSPATALSATNIANPQASPSATATYNLTETIAATGCSSTNSVVVGVRTSTAITTQPIAPAAICGGNGSGIISVAAIGENLNYQWRRNGTDLVPSPVFQGVDGDVLTINNPTTGDAGNFSVLVSGACGSSTSTAVAVSVTTQAVVGVSINATNSTICSGASVTFTATPTNGGSNPSYQWQVNGANTGSNSPTFVSNSLTDGTQVRCILTSNLACVSNAQATSNVITMTVNPTNTPSVSITVAPSSLICAGSAVTFTATPVNGGSSPSYQWRINGSNVSGATSDSFTSSTLTNGQVVSCVLTSNASCLSATTATSNNITMTVNATTTPAVSISANVASPICEMTPVTFTASATQAGSSPNYQWRRNGVIVGSNATTLVVGDLATGESITCRITSNAVCPTSSTATSNTISMVVNPNVAPVVVVNETTTGSVCPGGTLSFEANIANAGNSPNFQWRRNGIITGSNQSTFSSSALAQGDVITCTVSSSNTCASPSAVNSNAILVNFSGTQTYFLDADDDGYGTPLLTISSCTPISGYVSNNFDCNDNNADTNPGVDEWNNALDDNCNGIIDENTTNTLYYKDNDGDNYGNNTDTLRWFALPYGYCLVGGDCDDANPAIRPGRDELCNGFDDDCNILIDEGCGAINDHRAFALVVNPQTFPGCSTMGYSLAGATPTQGSTGEDVWFYFTATGPGARIAVFSSINDVSITLETSGGTVIDTENHINGVGNEALSFVGLTLGDTYYIRVRNVQPNIVGSDFSLCLSVYMPSFYNAQSGTFNLCESHNTQYTAAYQYTVQFNNTSGGNSLIANTAPNSTLVVLNTIPGLAWGQSYSVKVDAHYRSLRGDGSLEPVTVPGTQLLNMTIANHGLTQLRTLDACPNNRLMNSTLGMASWVCGAVDYQWEFTRTAPTTAAPVVVTRGITNTFLPLNMVPGLIPGATYNVRIRPILPAGIVGTWGPSRCLRISGTAALTIVHEEPMLNSNNELRKAMINEDEGLKFNLFPNPCNGETVHLTIENMLEPEFDIRIFDLNGKLIYSEHVAANGNIQMMLQLEGYVPSGLYTMELGVTDQFKIRRKLMVNR
jgi:hypothetical protein